MERTLASKVFKSVFAVVLVFACAFVFLLAQMALPSDAQAASWHKTGVKLTNGKASITYEEKPHGQGGKYSNTFVYYKSAPGKKKVELFESPSNCIKLLGYYKGKIFYSVDYSFSGKSPKKINTSVLCYDIKTKKTTRLTKEGFNFEQKGNYLVGRASYIMWEPRALYTINMKNNKVKKIAKSSGEHRVINGRLYYVITKKTGSYGYYKNTVWSCKLDGTHKKRLSESFRCWSSAEIVSAHKVKYYDPNAKSSRYYRF